MLLTLQRIQIVKLKLREPDGKFFKGLFAFMDYNLLTLMSILILYICDFPMDFEKISNVLD